MSFLGIEKKLHDLAQRIKEIDWENEFIGIDLNHLKQKLENCKNFIDQQTFQ